MKRLWPRHLRSRMALWYVLVLGVLLLVYAAGSGISYQSIAYLLDRGTGVGRRVKEIMDAGRLVSDVLILDILGQRIVESDCARGFILDGFPRNRKQAESLDIYLAALNQTSSLPLVRLVVSQLSLLTRLAARYICPSCGAGYSGSIQRPRVPGRCDFDGSSLIVREDDRKETILERLRIYELQISPIVDHYALHDAVLEVDGNRPVDEVTAEVLRAIRLRCSGVEKVDCEG